MDFPGDSKENSKPVTSEFKSIKKPSSGSTSPNNIPNLVKSLDSGLSSLKKSLSDQKKNKKMKNRKLKTATNNILSWPSDSDITVLRMKLNLAKQDDPINYGNLHPGDGQHQDNPSMINLATLMLQSQPNSKQSVNLEEYLKPWSSWEKSCGPDCLLMSKDKLSAKCMVDTDICSYNPMFESPAYPELQEGMVSENSSRKSKLAHFLRLYFCPCCSCLYEMENMSKTPTYD